MAAKSVFLSHASQDDAIVRALRNALESLGIEPWDDSQWLSAGDLLNSELRKAIERTDHFLILVSLHAMNSEWVEREIDLAKAARKKIIPLVRPEIGKTALRRMIGEEPIYIPLADGPGAITAVLPDILVAIGLELPKEVVEQAQEQARPVADLILELTDPTVAELDGKRRAVAVAKLTYRPPDAGPMVESGRYRFTAPLGPIEGEEIKWYLERYINWPAGLFQERAQRVVEALPRWGRALYDAVNDPDASPALAAWKAAANSDRRFTVKADRRLIKGTPNEQQKQAAEAATLLLALPWELIHDADGYLFQDERPVRVRRSLPNTNWQPALATLPPIRVLLVSPRPEDDSVAYIDHRVSARPLVEALSQSGDLASFQLLDPPTLDALQAELERTAKAGEPYHVVHFDGHGVYDRQHGLGMLCFEDAARSSQLVGADKIADIVRHHRIPLFFLEACQTAQTLTDPAASVAGRLLESGVASVVAMSHSVLVETARLFIAEFYRALLSGKPVGQAMLWGQRALKANTLRGKTFLGEMHLEDWFVPVLFQEEQDPQLIREVPATRVRAVIAQQEQLALGWLPSEPPHQFLGRSRDLLRAERILARERYLVVQGSGGEGKTTFAAELARWLVATRRFERAAFASVEQITEARQVLHSIGAQLIPNFETRVGTDDELGCKLLERALGEHRAVLLIDNVESILGNPAEILELCGRLGKAGQTRLIFTTREALPVPFDGSALRIGRLDRDTAIRLVGNLLPNAPKTPATEEDLENLVDAVGGHARALVLIAREVGDYGVRHATQNLLPILQAIEAKHPDDRENSLLASAELSLRRLPAEMRRAIRPLSVFQGGGALGAIESALQLGQDQALGVARALIGVGLAELIEPGYLRFDPALFSIDLTPAERDASTIAWVEGVLDELGFLYEQEYSDPRLAHELALLDMANLLAALERLATIAAPERVVQAATALERLVSALNRPRVLARVVEIRTEAARALGEWSNARFEAERASIERLIYEGRWAEAAAAAKSLLSRCDAAGEAAYPGAADDGAMAEHALGRALRMSGDVEAALPHLDRALQQFENLKNDRMAIAALTDKADGLADLGRFEDAAKAYQQVIAMAEQQEDRRAVAVGKGQLAAVRGDQKNFPEALRLYSEALEDFERIHEPATVANLWHRVGIVYQDAGDYQAAEDAYQKSLNLSVQTGNRADQAATLGQLGNLYSALGRTEDAVRLFRQAAEIFVALGDLRSEAGARNGIAIGLTGLRRFDEARSEIERAIECRRPLGHAAEPWTSFNILSNLERAVGNQSAALAAWKQAVTAYFAHRSEGGAAQFDTTELVSRVKQNPAAARAALNNPDLAYRVAAEIMLALERLG